MLTRTTLLLLAACTWLAVRLVQSARRRRKLPPGPPGWPIIGNVLSWPQKEKWWTFMEWAREYGDLTYANLLGTDMIVLNTRAAAYALLDARSADFSDRPTLFFLCNLVGWSDYPALQNWGPDVNMHRRLLREAIGTTKLITAMEPAGREHTFRCIRRIMDEPEQLRPHLRTLSCASVLNTSHGYNVKDADDKFVKIAEQMSADLSRAFAPGTFLVDLIPALNYLPEWFPGAGFKKTGAKMYALRERFMNEPFDWTMSEITAGRGRPSYIATHSAGKDLTHAEQRTLQWGATLLFLSANDTTSGSMMTFVLCMLLNPAAQRRVHVELDALVGTGPDRLPALADRESLPYLEACIWEALRLYPVAPEGMVHMARVDSIHEGRFIPKGTLLIPNVWAFAHDPNTYADPFEFRPERFLGPTPEPLPDFVYGFGRRACAGQLLAQCTMFTFAANLLVVCSIEHAKGPDGQDIEVKPEFIGAVTIAPKPFPCVIKPRSQRAKALLEAALASADS